MCGEGTSSSYSKERCWSYAGQVEGRVDECHATTDESTMKRFCCEKQTFKTVSV